MACDDDDDETSQSERKTAAIVAIRGEFRLNISQRKPSHLPQSPATLCLKKTTLIVSTAKTQRGILFPF